jgi:hypothetical protein
MSDADSSARTSESGPRSAESARPERARWRHQPLSATANPPATKFDDRGVTPLTAGPPGALLPLNAELTACRCDEPCGLQHRFSLSDHASSP